MDQVSIKYTIISNCKTLQNLPKFRFMVWKQTIWQPCFGPPKFFCYQAAVAALILRKNYGLFLIVI
jgi:hypothetical protein